MRAIQAHFRELNRDPTDVALRYEQALSLGQIAQQIGSTLDAVHKALSRLRARLQECVEQRLAAAGESP